MKQEKLLETLVNYKEKHRGTIRVYLVYYSGEGIVMGKPILPEGVYHDNDYRSYIETDWRQDATPKLTLNNFIKFCKELYGDVVIRKYQPYDDHDNLYDPSYTYIPISGIYVFNRRILIGDTNTMDDLAKSLCIKFDTLYTESVIREGR